MAILRSGQAGAGTGGPAGGGEILGPRVVGFGCAEHRAPRHADAQQDVEDRDARDAGEQERHLDIPGHEEQGYREAARDPADDARDSDERPQRPTSGGGDRDHECQQCRSESEDGPRVHRQDLVGARDGRRLAGSQGVQFELRGDVRDVLDGRERRPDRRHHEIRGDLRRSDARTCQGNQRRRDDRGSDQGDRVGRHPGRVFQHSDDMTLGRVHRAVRM